VIIEVKRARCQSGRKKVKKRQRKKSNRRSIRLREISEKSIEILPVIELAIYEVDKIFENQGDLLTDKYVIDSLEELVKMIRMEKLERLLREMREEMMDDSDIIHWNILSRIDENLQIREEGYLDEDLVEAINNLIETIKLQISDDNPRAYLSFLSDVMRGIDISRIGRSRRPGDEIDESDFDEDIQW
jgi:hypothetical protein